MQAVAAAPADPALAPLAAEVAACAPGPAREGLDESRLLDHARGIAQGEKPHAGCPRDLALRLAEALAATPGTQNVSAQYMLANMYERGQGVAADPARAREYRQRGWLLNWSPWSGSAFASPAERDAYLARDDTIAFLRPYAARPDQAGLRVRLVRALLARNAAGDRREARALLGDYPSATIPEARYLGARLALERGEDEAALAELQRLAWNNEFGAEIRPLLIARVQRRLARRLTPARRWETVEALAHLASPDEPASVAALVAAATAGNNGRAPATITGPAAEALRFRLRPQMSDDDYPAAALRGDDEGRIVLRGLIDPRGRLIFTEPVRPGQPPSLVSAVRRIYRSRGLPGPIDLGPARTMNYMWIELPGIVFVITGDD